MIQLYWSKAVKCINPGLKKVSFLDSRGPFFSFQQTLGLEHSQQNHLQRLGKYCSNLSPLGQFAKNPNRREKSQCVRSEFVDGTWRDKVESTMSWSARCGSTIVDTKWVGWLKQGPTNNLFLSLQIPFGAICGNDTHQVIFDQPLRFLVKIYANSHYVHWCRQQEQWWNVILNIR